jgi:hypothetical protein
MVVESFSDSPFGRHRFVMTKDEYFKLLFEYVENRLSTRSRTISIANEVVRLEAEGGIPAQKEPGKGKFEEIFTSVFLANEIAGFHLSPAFRGSFELSISEIQTGLAYEGWNQPDMIHFDSSPTVSVGFKAVLSKGANSWKGSWGRKDASGGLSPLAPCPDISFKAPLPFTAVGDVKYYRDGLTLDHLLNGLHQAVKEVFFYYSALNIGMEVPFYENGFLIIGDATPGHLVMEAVRSANPGLEDRLFNTPGFYMKVLPIT